MYEEVLIGLSMLLKKLERRRRTAGEDGILCRVSTVRSAKDCLGFLVCRLFWLVSSLCSSATIDVFPASSSATPAESCEGRSRVALLDRSCLLDLRDMWRVDPVAGRRSVLVDVFVVKVRLPLIGDGAWFVLVAVAYLLFSDSREGAC